METYTITASYYEGETSKTLSINVKAINKNDAFIIGAGKIYALFAGTESEIVAIGVTQPA